MSMAMVAVADDAMQQQHSLFSCRLSFSSLSLFPPIFQLLARSLLEV